MDKIRIDPARLSSSSQIIAGHADQMKKYINEMCAEVDELNGMWNGPAGTVWKTQFQAGKENLEIICAELKSYAEELKDAATQYDRCDAAVSETVSSILV